MELKHLFFTVCFLIGFFHVSKAQIKKGSIFLGGNISFSSVKYKIDLPADDPKKQNAILIQPIAGKAIKENTVIGIYLGFGYLNSDNIGSSVATKTTQYAGAVFLRKYKPIGAGFNLFGQADLYFLHEEQIYNRDIETENTIGPTIGLSFYPGISYAVSKKLHLETGFNSVFNVSYTHENRLVRSRDNIITAKSTMNYFGVQTSLNNISGFTLGFRLLISK